jgi:hypothetical protein
VLEPKLQADHSSTNELTDYLKVDLALILKQLQPEPGSFDKAHCVRCFRQLAEHQRFGGGLEMLGDQLG